MGGHTLHSPLKGECCVEETLTSAVRGNIAIHSVLSPLSVHSWLYHKCVADIVCKTDLFIGDI